MSKSDRKGKLWANSSPIRIWVLILNKILSNWIQQYMKKIIHHNKDRLYFRMKDHLNVKKSINVNL